MGEILQRKYGALRKCLGLLLSLVMVFSTMTITPVSADDNGELEVSTWTVTITRNGVELTSDTTVSVAEGDEITIEIEWTFDSSYSGNYTKTIDLGISGIVLKSSYSTEQKLYVDGEEVGTWYINDSGQLVVTLYEAYLQTSGKHGGFELSGYISIDDSEVNSDGTATIEVFGTKYTVYYTQSTGWVDVSKTKGTATINSDGTVTQEFTASITAHSKSITLSSVDDIYSGYSTLGSSFVVTYADGSTAEYTTWEALSNALAGVTLDAESTISITYTATVDSVTAYMADSSSYNNYTNKVTFNYKDVNNEDQSGYSTTYGVNVTKPSVYKTATSYDETTGELTWTITVNLGDIVNVSGFDVNKISLTDILGSELSGASVSWSDFTETSAGSGVYTYTYTTYVSSDVMNSVTSVTVDNTVNVTLMDGVTLSDTESYTVAKSLLSKSNGVYDDATGLVAWTITLNVPSTGLTGTSGNSYYVCISDYDSTWGKMPVTAISIDGTTVYTGGAFTSDAANYIKVDGNWPSSSVSSSTGFSLYMTEDYMTSKKGGTITIVVYTDPDEDNITSGTTITNTASLTSEEQNESASGTWTYTKTSTVSTSSLEKTGTVSSSDNYTVDYELDIDLNSLVTSSSLASGENISITDILPDGMTYVDGSLSVSLVYIDAYGTVYTPDNIYSWVPLVTNKLIQSDLGTVTSSYDSSSNALTIDVVATANMVDSSYLYAYSSGWPYEVTAYLLITYQGTLTDSEITALATDSDHQKTYTNNATVVAGSYSDTGSASVAITQNDIVSKSAYVNTLYDSGSSSNGNVRADYEVIVNPDALTLSNTGGLLTATDTLGSALLLDVTTIKVYEVSGSTETLLTAGTDYYFSYDADTHTLTLSLPDSTSLKITYTAYINAAVGEDLTGEADNSFVLSADYAWNNSDSVSITNNVTRAEAWIGNAALEVYKYSDDGTMTPLTGAKFTVYGTTYDNATNSYSVDTSNVIVTGIETDSTGKAVVTLGNDEYDTVLALVETDAPEGYLLDETPYYFVLLKATASYATTDITAWESAGANVFYNGSTTSGSTRIIYMENSPSVTLNKTDESGDAIENVVFGIYTDSACADTDLVEKITTNGLGIAQTTATYATGTYYLKELDATSGYEVNSTVYVLNIKNTGTSLTVTISNADSYVYMKDDNTINFIDVAVVPAASTVTTTVEISKTDSGTGDELPGATLTLKSTTGADLSDATVTVKLGTDAELKTQTADEITFVSGSTETILSGLAEGTYTLEEVTAPDGYKVTTVVTFYVDADGNVTADSTETRVTTASGDTTSAVIALEDDAKGTATVEISKTDSGTGDELPGATLTLKSTTGADLSDATVTVNLGTDATLTTQSADEITFVSGSTETTLSGLAEGTYTLKEVAAPEGYEVTTTVTFYVDEDGNVTTESTETRVSGTGTNTAVIVLEDDAKAALPAYISVHKVDGSGVAIAGVEFSIYETLADATAETNEIETIVTDENGDAETVNSYSSGTYYLKETKAADGYVELTDIYTIVIAADYASVSIVIEGVSASDTTVTISNNVITVVNTLATATPTPETSASATPTTEATATATPTAEATATATPTTEATATATATPTTEATATATPTAEATATATATATPTAEATATATATPTAEATATATPTVTAMPTSEATATATATPTPEATATATATPTPEATATATPTPTPEVTASVKISKVDITGGEELEGATLQIIDENGNVVEEWVSTDTPVEITGLSTGVTYTLRETVAPTGYEIATDTTFVLDENGEIDTTQTTTTVSDDGVLLVEDSATEENSNLIVEVLDEESGEPVEGAVVDITDSEGNTVELVTGVDGKVYGDFEIGDYTIEVVSVPDGYTVTTGQSTTVTLVENETAEHQAIVSKLDGGQLGDSDSGTLPITGMLVWPISVLTILGALFTLGGVIDNRRRKVK